MRIFVMRHGPAEERAPGGDDRARPLSADGREKTRLAARGLAALGVADEIDAALTSPLARARETAEIAARELGVEDIVETEALAPGCDPAAVLREARRAAKRGVLLVGHEPDMGALLSWLLAGSGGAVAAPFKKAAVACVELEGGGNRGGLVWFATPGMLRAIGGAG
jgi:phosphohistidine phosphatase